jgi:hypothetical protein
VKKGWELCVTDPLNTKREGKQRASISNRERGQHFYARTYGLLAMCLVFFCCIYGDLLDRAETRHSHVAMLAILAG